MERDRNYWLERGENGPKRVGYICIGRGDRDFWLSRQIGVLPKDLWMDSGSNDFYCHNNGNSPNSFYYITERKFNELFPEPKNKNMNRKFRIKSEEHSRAIQNRLFELGHHWSGTGRITVENLNKPFLFAEDSIKDITHCDSESYFENHEYTESTLDDLFEKIKPIEVKLNKEYTAVIHKDKIVVGCQTFSMEVFEELKKAVDKIKE